MVIPQWQLLVLRIPSCCRMLHRHHHPSGKHDGTIRNRMCRLVEAIIEVEKEVEIVVIMVVVVVVVGKREDEQKAGRLP